jgi:hypothetical protein
MAVQRGTVRLPDKLYDQVKRRAQRTQRSVADDEKRRPLALTAARPHANTHHS